MVEREPGETGSGRRSDAVLVAAARMAPMVVQLGVTPFVIQALGSAAYSVWALMMTTINLFLVADLGVVGVMQRYHGLSRGRQDAAFGGRVTATVLTVLAAALLVVTLVGPVLSDIVLALVDVAPAVRVDAAAVFRHTGTIAVLQLIGLAFSAYLAAHERFLAVFTTSLVARSVSFTGIVLVVVSGGGLRELLWCAYLDASLCVLFAAWACRTHLLTDVRRWLHRHEVADIWGYAWRNQASGLGFIAQRELDVLLAGALLPAGAFATVAAAAPLTVAVSLAPVVLLTPLFTTLSVLAAGPIDPVLDAARRAQRGWLSLALPYSVIVLAVFPPAAAAWIGPEIDDVAVAAGLLALGFLAGLAGSMVAVLVRATGRPGIETVAYVAYLGVKVVLGVVLARTFGIVGLALSGLAASIVMVLWLRRGARRAVGSVDSRIPGREMVRALLVGVVAAALSWTCAAAHPPRPVELLVDALVALAAAVVLIVLPGRRRAA